MGRQIHFYMLGRDCDAFFTGAMQCRGIVRETVIRTANDAARYQDNRELANWYEKLAGWLRRHFHRYRIASSTFRVGPDAWEWHRTGGVFLPMVRPPVTPTWRRLLGVAERESAVSEHEA